MGISKRVEEPMVLGRRSEGGRENAGYPHMTYS